MQLQTSFKMHMSVGYVLSVPSGVSNKLACTYFTENKSHPGQV